MRSLTGWTSRILAVLILAAALPAAHAAKATVAVRPAPPAVLFAEDAPKAKCCFTNPGYSGTCEVEPAKDETCAQILDYLNNQLAHGKSYCLNTDIRGGWKQAACEQK